jgi:hypothetical protein
MRAYLGKPIYQTRWKVWKDRRLVSVACSFMGALYLKNSLIEKGADPVATFITKERLYPFHSYAWRPDS